MAIFILMSNDPFYWQKQFIPEIVAVSKDPEVTRKIWSNDRGINDFIAASKKVTPHLKKEQKPQTSFFQQMNNAFYGFHIFFLLKFSMSCIF